jgi:hypothetical protein
LQPKCTKKSSNDKDSQVTENQPAQNFSPVHPYYQLNYVYGGKKTSEFVRPQNLKQVRTQLANYKRFRCLTDQWVGSALKLARLEWGK